MGITGNMLGGGSIFRASSPYPQCRIFKCTKAAYMKTLCCAYCEKRETCADPCLNHPEKCGMCVVPPQKEGGKVWELGDANLPDAPEIARAERTGLAPWEAPFEDEGVKCPICGKLCDTIYKDMDGDVFGCENCVREMDAGEWEREENP